MESSLFDIVKKYYADQLPERERTEFEARLSADEEFRKEVLEYARVYELVQREGDARLNETLSQLGHSLLKEASAAAKESPGPIVRPMSNLPRPLVIAAAAVALLLVIALPVWFYQSGFPGEKKTTAELYSSNFRPPAAPMMRDQEAPIPPWKEAYMAGEYPEAIRLLETLLEKPDYEYRSEAFLYLGLSYLAADQPQRALDAFQQVSSESFDHADAQWYQALAYLKLEELGKARDLLKQISGSTGNPFESQAKQLLAEL